MEAVEVCARRAFSDSVKAHPEIGALESFLLDRILADGEVRSFLMEPASLLPDEQHLRARAHRMEGFLEKLDLHGTTVNISLLSLTFVSNFRTEIRQAVLDPNSPLLALATLAPTEPDPSVKLNGRGARVHSVRPPVSRSRGMVDGLHNNKHMSDRLQKHGILVIRGARGAGKTQLALEIAASIEGSRLLLIRASSKESAIESVGRILEPVDGVLSSDTLGELRVWLQRSSDWVLVVDDLNDVSLFDEIDPGVLEGGQVLVTTSNPSVLAGEEAFILKPLDESQCRKIVQAAMPGPVQLDDLAIGEFNALLGGSPLAIQSACAYLVQRGLGLRDLSARIEAGASEVLDAYQDVEGRSIVSIFEMLVDSIEEVPGVAKAVLSVSALAHPVGIRRDAMLGLGFSGVDSSEMERVIDGLVQLNLLRVEGDEIGTQASFARLQLQRVQPWVRRDLSRLVLDKYYDSEDDDLEAHCLRSLALVENFEVHADSDVVQGAAYRGKSCQLLLLEAPAWRASIAMQNLRTFIHKHGLTDFLSDQLHSLEMSWLLKQGRYQDCLRVLEVGVTATGHEISGYGLFAHLMMAQAAADANGDLVRSAELMQAAADSAAALGHAQAGEIQRVARVLGKADRDQLSRADGLAALAKDSSFGAGSRSRYASQSGQLYSRRGSFREAREMIELALSLDESGREAKSAFVARDFNDLGVIQIGLGDHEVGLRLIEDSIWIYEANGASEALLVAPKVNAMRALSGQLAHALRESSTGDLIPALRQRINDYRGEIEVCIRSGIAPEIDIATYWHELGVYDSIEGRHASAARAFYRAAVIDAKVFGHSHRETLGDELHYYLALNQLSEHKLVVRKMPDFFARIPDSMTGFEVERKIAAAVFEASSQGSVMIA